MTTKPRKTILAFLDDHGFTYDRTNTKSIAFYVHPSCAEVGVAPSVDDEGVKRLIRRVQKQLGEPNRLDVRKRNVSAIKERQAVDRAEHAAEIARHTARIDELIRQREQRLDGLGAVLTNGQLEAIARLIEQHERERRELEALMTSIPAPGRSTVKHRS